MVKIQLKKGCEMSEMCTVSQCRIGDYRCVLVTQRAATTARLYGYRVIADTTGAAVFGVFVQVALPLQLVTTQDGETCLVLFPLAQVSPCYATLAQAEQKRDAYVRQKQRALRAVFRRQKQV